MNSIEFGKMCQPYNKQYRDLFGYVPCRGDYSCSQEEYFNALQKAIEQGKELDQYLFKHTQPTNPNIRW